MHTIDGFSLIELLITLTIISLLAGLCLPLYSQHIAVARRSEAKITLEQLAGALENYYTMHNTYENATLSQLGFTTTIAENNYQLAINLVTPNSFSLSATPLPNQAKQDPLCGTLTLSTTSKKGITGNGQIADCWG